MEACNTSTQETETGKIPLPPNLVRNTVLTMTLAGHINSISVVDATWKVL